MVEATSDSGAQSRLDEDAAFVAALSAEFRPSLTRYFAKRVKNPADIEDLVQEVFLRLLKRASGEQVDYAGAYIFRTAASVFSDWVRNRTARRTKDHEEFETDLHGEVDFTPERVLMGRERLEKAIAILMELPERTRTIFVLRHIEGLRFKDICVRLGMPVRTVENHMARALSYLAARIDED